MARQRQCWAFSTLPRSSRKLAHIFRACGWSFSVHLERALTELFRELELTFVQAVNLLGNCLLLGKLVILGALLWFGFPYDGPCSQGAVTETLLMLVAMRRSCRGTRVAASHGENDAENSYDFPLTSKSRKK